MTEPTPLPLSDELPGHRRRASATARFGVFELDLKTGELRRSGIKVKLQEQPCRLLAFLLTRPGEVVSREEIREELWPTDFVDFDHSLNTAVRKLRTALDDSADNPRFVETLARRGYRFIAPVTMSGTTPVSGGTTPGADDAAIAAPPLPSRRLNRVLAAVAILSVVAVAAFFAARRLHPPVRPQGSRPQVAAVAVLPFLNENPATEHLSDGLSEILIDTLSRVTDLRVMGRTTVFRFKGQPFDPQKIGRELKVAAVVTGVVRSNGDRHTIDVELIDTTDGSRIWGEQYQSAGSTLPSVQIRIAEDLSNRLRRGLKRQPASRAYSQNPQAHDLYLRGLQALNRRGKDDLLHAVEFFNRALGLDPGFAAGYAGLAQAYGVMVGYELIPSNDGAVRVLSAARKALELDPTSSDAYLSMATTKFRTLWDFEGASVDYRRALALNPSNATAHQWYADYLRTMGRFEEGRAENDRAWELDPFSPVTSHARCYAAFTERNYELAIARGGSPELQNLRRCLSQALIATNDYERAVAQFDNNRVRRPAFEELARGYRESGPKGFLRARLKILHAGQLDYDLAMDTAETHALLGENDAAFAVLGDAYTRRLSRLTSFHFQPMLDGLRADPRFEDLARRIGIPPEALAAADELRRKRPFTFRE